MSDSTTPAGAQREKRTIPQVRERLDAIERGLNRIGAIAIIGPRWEEVKRCETARLMEQRAELLIELDALLDEEERRSVAQAEMGDADRFDFALQ